MSVVPLLLIYTVAFTLFLLALNSLVREFDVFQGIHQAVLSLVAPTTQDAPIANEKEEEDEAVHEFRRRLGRSVDDLTLERYKAAEPGHRKPPIYYSERYLPRARPDYTDEERRSMTKEWGSWTLVDAKADQRPKDDFYAKFPNRDVPFGKFPDTAWQKDKAYLDQFISEALALTERAMEAILAEYAFGKKHRPKESFEERSVKFEITVDDKHHNDANNGGWMNTKSWEGLKRRLRHAIMTEDRFNFAMGGHSAAAGHGNHFQQSYTVQIQRILEPIFARLGVKMVARNIGMGGLGTLQNSLGAADIYGHDSDILMWDSAMTERETAIKGIFSVQALVGMDRAPFMWTASFRSCALPGINAQVPIDFARYGSATAGGWTKAANKQEFEALPWAAQHFACNKELQGFRACDNYEGQCWVDERNANFTWEGMDLSYLPQKTQESAPGGRASWHPGHHSHQLMGRLFTFVTLQALHQLFKEWNEKKDYILDDNEWHMTEYYATIKKGMLTHNASFTGFCSSKKIPTQFCMYPSQSRTEFTPRANAWRSSLRSIVAGSEHPEHGLKSAYDPPDIFLPLLHAPKGPNEVDVLAIVENGILPFPRNLARVKDSASPLLKGIYWKKGTVGKGSKHNPDIKGGKGWHVGAAGSDSCDGTFDSWCQRGNGSTCLLSGHNDGREGILMDGFSGWVIFNLPEVAHGAIIAQIYHWQGSYDPLTSGWCSENNEEPCKARSRFLLSFNSTQNISWYKEDTTTRTSWSSNNHTARAISAAFHEQQQRNLGKRPSPPWCETFRFEFAIDGKITSRTQGEFMNSGTKADRVVFLETLLDDPTWSKTKDVELAIRLTGCGREKPFSLTHLYWT